jgi:hypothetical protein
MAVLLPTHSIVVGNVRSVANPPCLLYVIYAPEQRHENGASEMSNRMMACEKSPDSCSLTLRIKLSMNPVYQLMPGKTAAAKNFRRVRKTAGDPSTLTNAVLRV